MSETITENKYTLRKLGAKDIFMMSKILSSIGTREFKNCFNSEDISRLVAEDNAEDNIEETAKKIGMAVMFDMAGIVLTNLPACEKYVYAFLADLSGLTEDEISSLPMDEFAEMIIAVIRKEEFKDFMKVVSKLFR